MIQKGGLALHNFIDLPNGLSSLCIPLGLHCQVNKQTEKHNYKIVVSNKSINSNIYNNIISKAKSSPFKSSKKNKIRLNRRTKKNRK
jgi:hypothetical protein